MNPSMEAAGKTSLFCTLCNPTWRSGPAHKASAHVTDAGSGQKYSHGFTPERLDSPPQRHSQTHTKPFFLRQHGGRRIGDPSALRFSLPTHRLPTRRRAGDHMNTTAFATTHRKRLLLSALLSISLLSSATHVQAGPQYGPWGFDLTAMDLSVKPGDDFNRYASGAWLDRTAIPADKPIVSLRLMMTDAIEDRLHDLMETAAANAQPATLEGRAGAFYRAFMDEGRVQALGKEPIAAEIAAINAAGDRNVLANLMGKSATDFYGSIYSIVVDVDLKNINRYAIYLGQAGLGLPDRDYYLKPSFVTQKSAYQTYVANVLSLLGWPDSQASAAAVVSFETRIAEASWTKVEQRDLDKVYNPKSRAELKALAPGFAWDGFLNGAGLRAVDRVIVSEKSAFPKIAAVYQSTPLPVVKAWQAFTVADNAAFYLSEPFSAARFQFRDHTLSGQPAESARWKRALRAVGGGDCYSNERLDCRRRC